MNRARHLFAAALVGVSVSITAGTVLAQTAQAPVLTPLLTGKKFTPPLRGEANIEILQPASKKEGNNVVTKIQVKNISAAPIARLTVDETWYDAGGAVVAGGKGVVNGMIQAGEVQTVTIETPYTAKMKSNNWNFAHANGTVKPKKVAKFDGGDSKDAAAPAKTPAKKKK